MKNTVEIFSFFDNFFHSKIQFENFKNNFYKGRFGSLPNEVIEVTIDSEEESVIVSHYLTEEYDEETGAFIGEDETNKKLYFEDYLKSQLNTEANTIYRRIENKFNDFLISKDGLDNYKKLVLGKFDTYLEKSEREPFKKYPYIKIIIHSLFEEIKKLFNPFSEPKTVSRTLKIAERATLNVTVDEFAYLIKILEECNVFEIKKGHSNKFFEVLGSIFENNGEEISYKSLYNKYTLKDIERDSKYFERTEMLITRMGKKNIFHKQNKT